MSDAVQSFSANDHVRLRPGMYFGGVGKTALQQLVYTVVDEAVAEVIANKCSQISIVLQSENQISISDNGLGLPTKFIQKFEKNALEVIMTGSAYRNHDLDYQVSGGLHGIGISAVNALSSQLVVETTSDGYLWRQTYEAGKPTSDVIQVRKLNTGEPTGKTIAFKPDFTIMEQNEFDYELIRQYMYESATMLKQATFTIRDERVQPAVEKVYHFESGLNAYLDDLRGKSLPLHFPITGHTEAKIAKTHYGSYMIQVDFIFQYIQSDDSQMLSYANLVRTTGGTHVSGFYSALRKILIDYGHEKGLINSKNGPLTWQQLSRGLIAIVHVIHPDPQFESQTKIKLLNPDVEPIVEQAVSEAFLPFAQQHPDVIEQIVRQSLKI